MRTLPYSLCALIVGGLLASPATSQVSTITGNLERGSAIFGWLDPAPVALTFVQHGVPPWRSDYEAVLNGSAKGENVRLGKDFWTSLHTTVPLTVGGTRVPAGVWYLNLFCDEKGSFHLTLMEAGRADARGYLPFTTAAWNPELKAPLEHKKTKTSVKKLTLAFVASDDPLRTKLKLTWGKHEMTASITVEATDLQEASAKAARPQ